MKVLITGSCGLVGSEAVRFYWERKARVLGLDNNMRAFFFGQGGSTDWRKKWLLEKCPGYSHLDLDIRDRQKVARVVAEFAPDLLFHCAAQPSHDLAARLPFEDFEVNAGGTLNLLEAVRSGSPKTVFVFMSTNKVYGDLPNTLALTEGPTRWEYADPAFANGIPESFGIDQSTHSLFGASKAAADLMVQEYGRNFGLATCALRGGCLTGSGHSGVELHGFLSYLMKTAKAGGEYTIFGYKGKQVRDQIHSRDVVRFAHEFYRNPRPGEVYNIGGGRENSLSVLEAIEAAGQLTGRPMRVGYSEENRVGDHICYYSDLSKMKAHYPGWGLTYSLEDIYQDLLQG